LLDFGLIEGYPSMLPSGLQADVFAQDELVLVVAPMHRWSEMRECALSGTFASIEPYFGYKRILAESCTRLLFLWETSKDTSFSAS